MEIKNLTKEELELMSYNDIAHLLLKDEQEQSTADLFKRICKLLGLSKKDYENKIGGFYTSLTTDKRFILLDSGNWDLKENHSVKNLKIDEILDDIEDIEVEETFDIDENGDSEDKEIMYDENPDDDNEDPTEDYKDLVIVDEEDLDNIE